MPCKNGEDGGFPSGHCNTDPLRIQNAVIERLWPGLPFRGSERRFHSRILRKVFQKGQGFIAHLSYHSKSLYTRNKTLSKGINNLRWPPKKEKTWFILTSTTSRQNHPCYNRHHHKLGTKQNQTRHQIHPQHHLFSRLHSHHHHSPHQRIPYPKRLNSKDNGMPLILR